MKIPFVPGFPLLLVFLLLAGCQSKTAAPEEAKAEEKPAVAVETVAASRQDVEETIAAQGTIVAAQGASVRLAPQAAGRLTQVAVREGDRVTAGQIVATLDSRAVAAQTRSAEAAFQAATSTAEQARISATAAASDQESGVRLARLTVDSALADRDAAVQIARTALQLAQTDLTRTEAGARPQEIAQALQAQKQAEATRLRASSEAERQQFLFDKGVSARRQAEDAQTALAVADSAVETARQSLLLIQAGARTEERNAARLRVRQASEALTQAIKAGDAKIAQANAALRQAQQQALLVAAKAQEAQAARDNAGKAAADVAAARTAADYSVLRAPISGVVTKRPLNPGDIADPAATVMEITDTRRLELLVSLPAADAARIRPGMKGHVSLSEGDETSGAVVSVGVVDPQSNLATARIRLENPNGRLSIGTFAQARVIVRAHPGAITVPKETLLTRDGKTVVYIAQGDTAKETPVEVGAEAENGATEILKGLSAGATVIRLGQYELADGAKITTVKKNAEGTDEKGGEAKP